MADVRKPDVVLYTIREDGQTYGGGAEWLSAYGLTEEDFGEGLRRHEVFFKTARPQQRDEDDAQRTVFASGNTLSLSAARVPVYIEKWNLLDVDDNPAELTPQGYASLPPVIAGEVQKYLNARVFPGLAGSAFFMKTLLAKRAKSSSAASSETPVSA